MTRMRREVSDFKPILFRIGVIGQRKLDYPAAVQALAEQDIDAETPRLFPAESLAVIDGVRAAGVTAISYRVRKALAECADRVVAPAVSFYRIHASQRALRLENWIPSSKSKCRPQHAHSGYLSARPLKT
jgi:hypothetical protein